MILTCLDRLIPMFVWNSVDGPVKRTRESGRLDLKVQHLDTSGYIYRQDDRRDDRISLFIAREQGCTCLTYHFLII